MVKIMVSNEAKLRLYRS